MSELVYLSPARSDGLMQRSHHFVRVYRRLTGRDAIWVEPYGTRLPQARDLCNRSREAGLTVDRAQKHRARVPALPLEPLPGLRTLNGWLWRGLRDRLSSRLGSDGWLVIARPSRFALDLASVVASGVRVSLDLMDDVPAFYTGISRRAMDTTVTALISRADDLWVTVPELAERYAAHRKVRLVPNACDPNALPEPAAEPVRAGLVYVGTLGDWLDWEWVTHLAEQWPDRSVELIGPVYRRPPRRLPANVSLVGPLPQADAYRRMQASCVGLIPFRVGPLTDAVDPLKYYEYLACGLSVLSTPTAPMRRRTGSPGVRIAAIDALAGEAREALTAPVDPMVARRVRVEESWCARFAPLIGKGGDGVGAPRRFP